MQGYRFQKSGLQTANPAVGDTLINYSGGLLQIGEIIMVDSTYVYTSSAIINMNTQS